MNSQKICKNCVMDTTDVNIVFDKNGICDHCTDFYTNVEPNWHTDSKGKKELDKIIFKIKLDGKDRDFDCIIGMSGGADSSYLLHKIVVDFGLRPLVFHVDGGWNSEIAVNNINAMIEKLDLDLYTEVINWEEMKDFQLSYFKAGVANIDVPQDHAFVATLYDFANRHKIKHIINGGNISTECVRNPLEWLYYGTDMSQINDIRKKFGTIQLKTYPFSSVFRHKIYLKYIRRVNVVKPLDFMPYIKSEAMIFLEKEYGWQPYPQKHFESRFTKFYEGYWLPKKFGYDTRKVQYSSLILTKQLKRDDALEMLKKPAIPDDEATHDFEYIAKKLGISTNELQIYFDQENKTYRDYKNQLSIFNAGAKILKMFGMERSIKR